MSESIEIIRLGDRLDDSRVVKTPRSGGRAGRVSLAAGAAAGGGGAGCCGGGGGALACGVAGAGGGGGGALAAGVAGAAGRGGASVGRCEKPSMSFRRCLEKGLPFARSFLDGCAGRCAGRAGSERAGSERAGGSADFAFAFAVFG